MEWVETTGRSVEEAKDRALDQLGVDEAEAEFDTVEEARTGLFGRVKAEARVRARVRPTAPPPKDSGRRNRRGSGGEGGGRPPVQRRASSEGAGAKLASNGSPAEKTDTTNGEPGGGSTEVAQAAEDRSGRTRRPRRPRTSDNEGASVDNDVALSEQGAVAEQFLQGFFVNLGNDVEVRLDVDEEEEIVSIAVRGDDLGHLIGPRGNTLQAVQELTRVVVQRKTGGRNGRIFLDIADYRAKRRVALEGFTRQIAEEVVSTGSARRLEPMNPADRKVVHDTVNEIDGASTTSEGEEPRRWVVVQPMSS